MAVGGAGSSQLAASTITSVYHLPGAAPDGGTTERPGEEAGDGTENQGQRLQCILTGLGPRANCRSSPPWTHRIMSSMTVSLREMVKTC